VTTWPNVRNVGSVKTGANCCSRTTNEEVSCIGRLPCCGDLARLVPGQILPKKQRRSRHQFYLYGPEKTAKLELTVDPEFLEEVLIANAKAAKI
jgi:hypothetical protein